jgi:hypothetical protein
MSTTKHRGPADSERVRAEVLAGQGLTLRDAGLLFPPLRQGRPVSPSCVWRWADSGGKTPDGRRVHLEVAWLSSRWLTSRPAVARFLEALNSAPPGGQAGAAPDGEGTAPPEEAARPDPARRKAEKAAAKAELRSKHRV